MKHFNWLISINLFFCWACVSDNKFDSVKWKSDNQCQYYMLKDLVEGEILIGKSKQQTIELLDTTGIKNYNYNDNSWTYVVSIPNETRATESPIKMMDIDFENEKVVKVDVRK